jgi:hypothetical protein
MSSSEAAVGSPDGIDDTLVDAEHADQSQRREQVNRRNPRSRLHHSNMKADEAGSEILSLVMDGMDQSKTWMPHHVRDVKNKTPPQ